jgi:hypothetical protein
MYPEYATAANFVPSEDEVIEYQDLAPAEVCSVQLDPPSLEV